MSRISTYNCDAPNCTQIRTPSNHWFIVRNGGSFSTVSLIILPFSEFEYDEPNDKCFCGETHTLQYIASQLSAFYPPKPLTIPLADKICYHLAIGMLQTGEPYCLDCGKIAVN